MVAIYQVQEQQYEVLVATGRVLTIQDNGLIQVGLIDYFDSHHQIVERLLENDKTVLDSIVVKPNVPRFRLPFERS